VRITISQQQQHQHQHQDSTTLEITQPHIVTPSQAHVTLSSAAKPLLRVPGGLELRLRPPGPRSATVHSPKTTWHRISTVGGLENPPDLVSRTRRGSVSFMPYPLRPIVDRHLPSSRTMRRLEALDWTVLLPHPAPVSDNLCLTCGLLCQTPRIKSRNVCFTVSGDTALMPRSGLRLP